MLAIAGGKGGCGKTTTALGVGAALHGQSVVVDADWDLPNLHRLAAVYRDGSSETDRPRETAAADVETGGNQQRGGERVQIERLGGVRVVPAPATPSEHEVSEWLTRVQVPHRDVDDRAAGDGIVDDRAGSDAIVVDCPAGASPDATAPLSVADATLLVTTAHSAAIRDTMKTAAMARVLDAEPVGLVVVGAESPPSGLRTALNTPVAGCVPQVDPPVLEHAAVASAYRGVVSHVTDACRTGARNS